MKYSQVIVGKFLRRPNRFIAYVDVNGQEVVVHVKNTGRCKELLVPGTSVYLEVSANPERKTKFDLIAVEKNRAGCQKTLLVNMDSQLPNAAASEWLPHSGLFSPQAIIRREVTWHNSRFDFFIEDGPRRAFLEVKGVTLEENGVASFPDAPTERGVKHIHELIECQKDGFEAFILFVIQMQEIHEFRPNDATHAAFGQALRLAAANGVHILAMDCAVTPDSMNINSPVPVKL